MSRSPLALAVLALLLSAGCTTTLVRSAKVRKGSSLDVAGMGLHYFDPENLDASGDDLDEWTGAAQFTYRYGFVAPDFDGDLGFSLGVRVPFVFYTSQLDLYLQLPKNPVVDWGIGVGLGYLCDVHFVLSRDFGPVTPIASFQYQVFLTQDTYQAFSPSLGLEVNLGRHVSLILAVSYFYARGDYVFLNVFNDDVEVESNTLNVSLGIDFHWGAPPPLPDA